MRIMRRTSSVEPLLDGEPFARAETFLAGATLDLLAPDADPEALLDRYLPRCRRVRR